jgi:hypothetical protein
MSYRGKRYLLCPMAIILSGFAACGTSAAITLRDGSMVSGKIISSDTDAVYIATANGEKTVARERIQDIDHPGNGAEMALVPSASCSPPWARVAC